MPALTSSARKLIRSIAVVGIAGAAVLASAPSAPADTAYLTPIVTLGHGLYDDQISACVGYIDVRAASDYPAPYPPNYVTFTTHFIGVSQVCVVSGTIEWRNLDTGQTGSRAWNVSGWDGPGAPTFASIDTGPGRVSLDITTTTPHIPSQGEFVGA